MCGSRPIRCCWAMQACVCENFLHLPPKPLRFIILLGQLQEIQLHFGTPETVGGGGLVNTVWWGNFVVGPLFLPSYSLSSSQTSPASSQQSCPPFLALNSAGWRDAGWSRCWSTGAGSPWLELNVVIISVDCGVEARCVHDTQLKMANGRAKRDRNFRGVLTFFVF